MNLASEFLVPLPGGVFTLDREEVIGAIGISGEHPDIDQASAIAEIDPFELTAQI